MISKKTVIEIINNPHLSADQLEFEYNKLNDDSQRRDFLDILTGILKDASEKEKTVCFNVIERIERSHDFELLIKTNIKNVTLTESQTYLNSLLWSAAELSNAWSIDFILRIIEHFKPLKREYSRLYDMGIRSLVSTDNWELIINEILWIVQNYSREQMVDFLAYFKWKKGDLLFEKLFQIINERGTPTSIANDLKAEIEQRYMGSYGKLG